MQMLCHISSSQPGPKSAAVVRWFCGLLMGALAMVGVASQPLQPQQAVPQTPQQALFAEASEWVRGSQNLQGNQFSIAPLDPRVRVQSCARSLDFDLPFGSRDALRVRCLTDPSWQMYLRVVLAAGVPVASLAKAAPAPVPVAVPTAPPAGLQVPKAVAEVAPARPEAAQAPIRRVVVATQLLRRGTALTADMLQEVDSASAGLDAQAVSSVKDVENGEMVRDVMAGVPLRSHDVRRAAVVKQGQSVLLTVGLGGGFAITARVESLQDGKIGDQVRMKNPESGKVLFGVVSGPNAVRGL